MPYVFQSSPSSSWRATTSALHGLQCIHLRTCWVYGPGLPRPRVRKTLIDAAVAANRCIWRGGGDFRVDHLYSTILSRACSRRSTDRPSLRRVPRCERHRAVRSPRSSPAQELVPGAQLSVGPGAYRFADNLAVVRKGALDIRRARAELGYVPRYDMRSGLAACVNAARGGAA